MRWHWSIFDRVRHTLAAVESLLLKSAARTDACAQFEAKCNHMLGTLDAIQHNNALRAAKTLLEHGDEAERLQCTAQQLRDIAAALRRGSSDLAGLAEALLGSGSPEWPVLRTYVAPQAASADTWLTSVGAVRTRPAQCVRAGRYSICAYSEHWRCLAVRTIVDDAGQLCNDLQLSDVVVSHSSTYGEATDLHVAVVLNEAEIELAYCHFSRAARGGYGVYNFTLEVRGVVLDTWRTSVSEDIGWREPSPRFAHLPFPPPGARMHPRAMTERLYTHFDMKLFKFK